MTQIKPAGMTLERALEIAMESDERKPFAVACFGNGNRLTRAQYEQIISSTGTAASVAAVMGISSRTVERVRADRVSWVEQDRRRANRESFRHMTEDWSEIAS